MSETRGSREVKIFSLPESVLELARDKARELIRTGDTQGSFKESGFASQLLVTREENEGGLVVGTVEVGEGIDRVTFFVSILTSPSDS